MVWKPPVILEVFPKALVKTVLQQISETNNPLSAFCKRYIYLESNINGQFTADVKHTFLRLSYNTVAQKLFL
jgi:hypothetical protein